MLLLTHVPVATPVVQGLPTADAEQMCLAAAGGGTCDWSNKLAAAPVLSGLAGALRALR